jgi:putative addiction module component (TIGR02574 family)
MSMPFEDVTREAIRLPRQQRLALARTLAELDEPGPDVEVIESTWDREIQARAQAVQDGQVEGIPYEQVLDRIDKRLGS